MAVRAGDPTEAHRATPANKDDRLAVIVLSNTSGADPGAVADRIASLILGSKDGAADNKSDDDPQASKPAAERPNADEPEAEKPIADEPIDAALIEQLTGKYRLMGEELEVISQGGQLSARLKGRARTIQSAPGQGTTVTVDLPYVCRNVGNTSPMARFWMHEDFPPVPKN